MSNPLYPTTTKITARMWGEYESREFWGDEQWKAWKLEYDQRMGFRKTFKGKPDEYDMAQIKINTMALDNLGFYLFHSVSLARYDRCDCTLCGQRRTNALKDLK